MEISQCSVIAGFKDEVWLDVDVDYFKTFVQVLEIVGCKFRLFCYTKPL